MLKGCYRLPWSQQDNPNGWIEPTTFCQLRCPGCYRGLDRPDAVRRHVEFAELQRQIDRHVRERNIQTVSIAGGEPLLYPQLPAVLGYARDLGLRTKIFTNGLALSEPRLRELKASGASEFIIHIDRFQGRAGGRTETELNELRESYCQMFRRVGGVNLGFIQPVSRDNLADVPTLLGFYRQRADVVSLVVFTLYSDVNWDAATRARFTANLTLDELAAVIQRDFPYQPCAYLGSTADAADPTWLFAISVGFRDEVLGFFDGKLYAKIQTRYHTRKGRYLFTKVGHTVTLAQLAGLLRFSSIRQIVASYAKAVLGNPRRLGQPFYRQTLLLLRGPKWRGPQRDLCRGCPDAMWHDGRLVPSCILEEVKLGRHPAAFSL